MVVTQHFVNRSRVWSDYENSEEPKSSPIKDFFEGFLKELVGQFIGTLAVSLLGIIALGIVLGCRFCRTRCKNKSNNQVDKV